MMKTPTSAFVAALAVVCGIAVSGQNPPATTNWVFEAASVKPNRALGDDSYTQRQPGGRFNAVNMPLKALITFAYQIQGYQLVDAPEWTADERFDIVAKLNGDPPPVQPGTGADPHMLALQSLLAERFTLVVRRETRQLDVYALVKLRADGRLGPALTQSNDECQRLRAAAGRGVQPPTGPGARFCGMRMNRGRIQFGGFPLSQLAWGISGQVGRLIVDRTGLGGTWDFELTYAPDPSRGSLAPGVDAPPVDTNAPSLFTALQEQLGLKLEATKGPVDVVVVERVDRPVSD